MTAPTTLTAVLALTIFSFPAVAEPTRKPQTGIASWYAGRAEQGGEAAADAFVAAHRRLPMGTRLRVTNRKTGQEVEVVVTDRGPFRRGRIIDVSRAAAERLGFLRKGKVRVTITVVRP